VADREATEREQALIAAMRERPDDRATAEVYADWLEENGFVTRAKFIRDESPEHAPPEDAAWRGVISHAAIASCRSDSCPKTWSALPDRPVAPMLRQCERCANVVQYCTSLTEVSDAVRRGLQIALDAAVNAQHAHHAMNPPNYVPMPTSNPPAPRSYGDPPPGAQAGVLSRLLDLFRRR
jgi:uncharacterized protein (TIGR02996 family)